MVRSITLNRQELEFFLLKITCTGAIFKVEEWIDLTDFCLVLQTIVLRECITHTYGVNFGSELSYTCSEISDPRLVPYD